MKIVSTYDLLMELKSCPGMYLGKKSLTLMMTYVNGFQHGQRESPLSKDQCERKRFLQAENKLSKLTYFTIGYYENCDAVMKYWNHILLNSYDEENAVDEFYRILEIFWRADPSDYYIPMADTNQHSLDPIYFKAQRYRDGIVYSLDELEYIFLGCLLKNLELNPLFLSPFNQFPDFVAKKYHKDPNEGWVKIINEGVGIFSKKDESKLVRTLDDGTEIRVSTGKKEKSLEVFFRLLDEFYDVTPNHRNI